MSASFRLAVATRGFRGGLGGISVTETIYVDQSITTSIDYESLNILVESVQAIGADFGPVEVDVEIEGCY